MDYSPWGCKESDMTEQIARARAHTHTHTHTHTHKWCSPALSDMQWPFSSWPSCSLCSPVAFEGHRRQLTLHSPVCQAPLGSSGPAPWTLPQVFPPIDPHSPTSVHRGISAPESPASSSVTLCQCNPWTLPGALVSFSELRWSGQTVITVPNSS